MAIYLRAFVPNSGANSFVDEACDPLLQGSSCSAATSSSSSSDEDLTPRLPPHKGGLPSLPDMYYLKAQFGYSKDEFANLMLIVGAAGMLSQIRTNVSKSVGSNEQVHWPFEGKKAKGSDGKRPN
ncbi:hypothetical protein ABZP36_015728 [Zizania latifolia]